MTDQHHNRQELAAPRQQSARPLVADEPDWNARLIQLEVEARAIGQVEAMMEIGACLTLVAPAGMNADDRAEWIKVAAMTIGDRAQGPLVRACQHARRTVRRVSDIVPAIIEKADEESRKLYEGIERAKYWIDNPPPKRIAAPAEPTNDKPLTVDELMKMTPLLRKIALRSGFVEPSTIAELERRTATAGGRG